MKTTSSCFVITTQDYWARSRNSSHLVHTRAVIPNQNVYKEDTSIQKISHALQKKGPYVVHEKVKIIISLGTHCV
jgi:hypothetical protein